MIIKKITVLPDHVLQIETKDGMSGIFDMKPYLSLEAFIPLRDPSYFKAVKSRGYYIEWQCGADLSADTIEARMKPHTTSKNNSKR